MMMISRMSSLADQTLEGEQRQKLTFYLESEPTVPQW